MFSFARDALAVVALLLLSLALGLAVNRLRSDPLPLHYRPRPAPGTAADLDLPQFEALVKSGRGVILDARPEPFYRLGHVPGALSLPREEFEAAFARLEGRLVTRRNDLLVVYCADPSCDDARVVQSGLRRLGFARVVTFPGGWGQWTGQGLSQEGTPR